MTTVPAPIHMTGPLDPRSGWTAANCPIARTIDLVGARPTLLILREAFYGTTRFDDFAERVGISESVAAARLRELVESELLVREPYREPGQRTRYEYRLTEKGADLLPALVALANWGERWLPTDAATTEVRHRDCGAIVGVELCCEAGHHVERDQLDLAVRRPAERS